MPIIRVEMFKERTDSEKAQLVSELTEAFVASCGGSMETVHVQLQAEGDQKECWGTGGQLFSESALDPLIA